MLKPALRRRRMLAGIAVALTAVATVVGVAPSASAATSWSRISVGHNHACGIQTNGSLWCWGSNRFGELGLGIVDDQPRPTRVGSDTHWTQVSAGWNNTCALTTTGKRYCWGYNSFGELGLGDYHWRYVPTTRPCASTCVAEEPWSMLSVGMSHTCGVTTSGRLYCWGDNAYGKLGVGDKTERNLPAFVSKDWATVAAGSYQTCGRKRIQEPRLVLFPLYCWGDNFYGALGLGTRSEAIRPTQVGSGLFWTAVTEGDYAGCGITGINGGPLYCWGRNLEGELGVGDTTKRLTPTRVDASTHWKSVSMSSEGHTCALDRDGRRYCWGLNDSGQLGLGDTVDRERDFPQTVGFELPWSVLSTGGFTTCGIHTNASLYCWGNNGTGQLGVGDTRNRANPERV